MRLRSARADIVRAINQRWLLKTWNERRGDRPLPNWLDLSGRDMAEMSKNLCFLDVIRDGGDLRFLMLGEVYGFDCHDQYLDEMQSGPFQDAIIATYRHVEATRSPAYASADITDIGGRLVHYERLLLPFGQDGETVDRILGSLEMISLDGTFGHRNLMLPTSGHRSQCPRQSSQRNQNASSGSAMVESAPA